MSSLFSALAERLLASRYGAARLILGLSLLHALVVLVFTRGYLLSRVELPHTNACPSASRLFEGDLGCRALQRYDRAVVIIVDALRYDMVCGTPTARQPNAGAMPRTLALLDARDAVSCCCCWSGGGGESCAWPQARNIRAPCGTHARNHALHAPTNARTHTRARRGAPPASSSLSPTRRRSR